MFCVKPKDLVGVLKNVSSILNQNHLVLSIAAGVQINKIESVGNKLKAKFLILNYEIYK